MVSILVALSALLASPHSFIPGLKPSFSAEKSFPPLLVGSLFFFRTDSTDSPDCLPILLSISVVYFLVLLFSTI